MKHQNLTPEELQLLSEVLAKHDPVLLPLLDQLHLRSLSTDQVESLRGALAGELVEAGLDGTYEPTRYGLRLEELIDKIGHFSDQDQ